MDAPRLGYFTLKSQFKHDNRVTVRDFIESSVEDLGKKDFSKPIALLESAWIENVGDLRLVFQEGQLRSLKLPLRLVVWIEEELVKQIGGSSAMSPDDGVVFRHSHDFDTNGIVYHIATKGGTQPWSNPADAGLIKVTSSGILGDSVKESAVVGRETVRCVTSAHPNAWFAIDLEEKWVSVTHYTLRHYSSWDTECLRSWRFEGSNDDCTWVCIREHVGDASLIGAGSTYTWPIQGVNANKPYRKFRIRMTGPNSNNHMYLSLSGIELYGTLYTQEPQGSSSAVAFPPKGITEFVHDTPFDENGIIYYLATHNKTQPFINPAVAGYVHVTASSLMHDSAAVSAVVGRDVVRCVTKPLEGSYMTIDFLDKRVQPTAYSIKHYSTWDTEALRNWLFQGSIDGMSWETIMAHHDDQSLQKKGQGHTWKIHEKFHGKMYKSFRITQTGLNSNNHHYLAISGFEIYGNLLVGQIAPPVVNDEPSRADNVYVYQSDFDHNGIIYNLSTDNGTKPFTNAAIAGKVVVQASSLMPDSAPISDFVDRKVVRLVTKPQPDSWMMIDFINKAVIPTHYSLRHYSTWDVEALRNWNLEGSNDGFNWTVIHKHTNDAALNAKGATYTWALHNVREQYRMFRLLQWGTNSNKHNYLACSGFEIYGRLEDVEPLPAMSVQNAMRWNTYQISAFLTVEEKENTVVNKGSRDKWQLVRSVHSASKGQQKYVVKLLDDMATTNTWKCIVGVISTAYPAKGKEWVGAHGSWGYIGGTGGKCHQVATSKPYGEPFGAGDVIAILCDFDQNTIEFFKNGVTQGVAFRNLQGPVHLAASFTGTGTRLQILDPAAMEQPLSKYPPTWDPTQKSRQMVIELADGTVMNRGSKDKWMAVRGVAMYTEGKHTFGIRVVHDTPTKNQWRFIVGLVTPQFPLTWVGAQNSYGYISGSGGKVHQVGSSIEYGPTWGETGDVILCHVDFDEGTISFTKNGKNLGVAFRNVKGPLYPAVCMTGTKAKVQYLTDV